MQRITTFDVTLDTRTIAMAAGKTLHLLSLPQGVSKALQEEGVQLDFAEQGGGEHELVVERELQQGSNCRKGDTSLVLQAPLPPDLPEFSGEGDLQPEVRQLKGSKSDLHITNAIYLYLHKLESSRRLVHLHKTETVAFILRLVQLLSNPSQAATAAYHIFSQMGTSISDGSLDKFALILAPRVFEKIQRA